MRCLVVDTSYLLYRSYFAYPNFVSAGTPTGALYGSIRAVDSITKQYAIDRLVFALDLPKPTHRDALYSEYKAGRPQMEAALKTQIPIVGEWARAVTPYVFSMEGYEADDMIASVVASKTDEDHIFVLSSDRDLYQLLTYNNVHFVKGVKGEYQLYGKNEFVSEFGIMPEQYTDYKALVGDSSDNIAGVAGIGPKTAQELLVSCGSLRAVFEYLNWEVPEYFRRYIPSDALEQYLQSNNKKSLLTKIFDNLESLKLAYQLSLLTPQTIVYPTEGFDLAKAMDLYTQYQLKSIQKLYGLDVIVPQKLTEKIDENALF